jgi:protein phosphatase
MSRIVLTAASRIGCVRSNNEDMVLAYDKLLRSDAYKTEFMTENTDRFIIALADGMGGHNAGEVASEETLSNLKFFIHDLPSGLTSGDMNEMMVEWLNSVNKMVNSHGLMDPSKLEMGTTLVGVLYYGEHYYWLNCGDSRLYRLRDGQLTQLTTDHSLTRNDGTHRHSNVITNCIGAGIQNSFIDFYEFTNDVLPGDTYLLCSDGLNDMISDSEIQELMAADKSANQLCEAAIEAGGFDNVSTCVFHIEK